MVLVSLGWQTHASIIFEFDNAEIEEFNFVGAEAADFGFSFGTETFELGDSLKVLISSTLNIIPTVYLFYFTIIKQSGSFSASSMKA